MATEGQLVTLPSRAWRQALVPSVWRGGHKTWTAQGSLLKALSHPTRKGTESAPWRISMGCLPWQGDGGSLGVVGATGCHTTLPSFTSPLWPDQGQQYCSTSSALPFLSARGRLTETQITHFQSQVTSMTRALPIFTFNFIWFNWTLPLWGWVQKGRG